MRCLILGLFFIINTTIPFSSSKGSSVLFLRGHVPQVQKISIVQTDQGLEMFFNQNSKNFEMTFVLEVKRKGLGPETKKLSSSFHSLDYQNQKNHPIQTVTLIQN